ncbi:hypothetical protein BDY21DRAFT_340729 [Lineolata rhizophorae]|uniref:Fungal-specific transcription factor domain-containing protein n=1 Tax=Lineolata rhizophorae TaxID=578093 RepID=A0A6A6P493_9PEZI|nr:hypothetical protein BDY21DRAFT_340729 [Lineolata rhizophorae]
MPAAGKRARKVKFRYSACPGPPRCRADYKKYEFFFDADQVWIDTRRSITFQDQTDLVTSAGNTNEDAEDTPEDAGESPAKQPRWETAQISNNQRRTEKCPQQEPPECQLSNEPRKRRTYFDPLLNNPLMLPSPGDAEIVAECPRYLAYDYKICTCSSVKEAQLLRSYMENVAPKLDVTNDAKHYSRLVPTLAADNPVLFNVILALGARLNKCEPEVGPYDPYLYLRKCTQFLVPHIHQGVKCKDEVLALASVLLRWFKDLKDLQGERPFTFCTDDMYPELRNKSLLELESGILKTAYWTHVRYEIISAAAQKRDIRANINDCSFDPSLAPMSEAAWSNRVVWICARAVRLTFGTIGSEESIGSLSATGSRFCQKFKDEWTSLDQMLQLWGRWRPDSFNATFVKVERVSATQSKGCVYHAFDEHVDATQHHLLGSLLLEMFNPFVPPRSLDDDATLKTKNTVAFLLRRMINVAMSNRYPPAVYITCSALVASRKYLQDRQHRDGVIQFLQRAERDYEWPTRAMVEAMTNEWGLEGPFDYMASCGR